MGGIECEAALLGRDQHDATARTDVADVIPEEGARLLGSQVLQDVGGQKGVEATGTGEGGAEEVVRRKRQKASFPAAADGVGVVIDADSVAAEVAEPAADAAANVERESQMLTTQIPAVGIRDEPLPPRRLLTGESIGIGG
jgi:hypothetical protein